MKNYTTHTLYDGGNMCKNRRDAIMDEIRKHFPIQYIARNILIGTDGVSREGYTTEFKRMIGKLLSQKTPPFIPSEIASVLGVDARCVMLWESKYRRGHFDKATPRDQLSVNCGSLVIVSHKAYCERQTVELRRFAKENNLTDEQYKHLSAAIHENTDTSYKNFRESDGDPENLSDYLELLFLEHITEPNTDYNALDNLEDIVDAQPIAETIDAVQQRIERLNTHRDNIRRLAVPPLTLAHLRCYRLSHRPDTPEDILISMGELPEWKTKQSRNRAFGRLLDYCDGYVGPHVDKKIIPLTIRSRLSKQVVHLPDDTWMVFSVKIMEYIENCRLANTWDWDVLLADEGPLQILNIPMCKASGVHYSIVTPYDGTLFGQPITDVNTWQYYVDIVRTMAPASAIKHEEDAPEASTPEPISTNNTMETMATSVIQTLVDEEEMETVSEEPSAVVAEEEATEVEATITKPCAKPEFEILQYVDNSYGGYKYVVELNLTHAVPTETENIINRAIVALLQTVSSEVVYFQNVVLIEGQLLSGVRLTGRYPERLHVPTCNKIVDNQLVMSPIQFTVGCSGNYVTRNNTSDSDDFMCLQTRVFSDKKMMVILTVADGKALHIEFI